MKLANKFRIAAALLLISTTALADRYGIYEDCEIEGNCGSIENAFYGFLLIAGSSLAVSILRLFSDRAAFILIEALLIYFSYFAATKEDSVFLGIMAFIGLQFWVWLLWEMSGLIKDRLK